MPYIHNLIPGIAVQAGLRPEVQEHRNGVIVRIYPSNNQPSSRLLSVYVSNRGSDGLIQIEKPQLVESFRVHWYHTLVRSVGSQLVFDAEHRVDNIEYSLGISVGPGGCLYRGNWPHICPSSIRLEQLAEGAARVSGDPEPTVKVFVSGPIGDAEERAVRQAVAAAIDSQALNHRAVLLDCLQTFSPERGLESIRDCDLFLMVALKRVSPWALNELGWGRLCGLPAAVLLHNDLGGEDSIKQAFQQPQGDHFVSFTESTLLDRVRSCVIHLDERRALYRLGNVQRADKIIPAEREGLTVPDAGPIGGNTKPKGIERMGPEELVKARKGLDAFFQIGQWCEANYEEHDNWQFSFSKMAGTDEEPGIVQVDGEPVPGTTLRRWLTNVSGFFRNYFIRFEEAFLREHFPDLEAEQVFVDDNDEGVDDRRKIIARRTEDTQGQQPCICAPLGRRAWELARDYRLRPAGQ